LHGAVETIIMGSPSDEVMDRGGPHHYGCAMQSRGRLTVTVSWVFAGYVLLALGACEAERAAGTLYEADASAEDAASPRPADAAVAPLASVSASQSDPRPAVSGIPDAAVTPTSQSDPRPTASGIPDAAVTPTSPVASMTTAPSTAPTLPVPSTTPSSGAVDAPELAGQANCEGTFSGTTPTFTHYDVVCDADSLWATCSLESTEVACVCGNTTTGQLRSYTLELGIDLETASRATVALCNGPSELASVEVDCEEPGASADECGVATPCTRLWDLGNGVEALETTTVQRLYCYAFGPTDSSCTCADPAVTMTVHGVTIGEACAAAAPVCDSEVPVAEDISCTESALSINDLNCVSSQRCGHRVDLDETGEVFALTPAFSRDVYCFEIDEGNSLCACSNGAADPFFTGDIAAAFDTACVIADDVCYSGAALQAVGALECGSLSVYELQGACSASADCAQDLSNGTSSIRRSAPLSSDCEPDGNGSWSCSCSGGGAETPPETVTAPTTIDACLNAMAGCAARGQLEIASNNEVDVVFSASADNSDAGAR
jgi:hypothetical protein